MKVFSCMLLWIDSLRVVAANFKEQCQCPDAGRDRSHELDPRQNVVQHRSLDAAHSSHVGIEHCAKNIGDDDEKGRGADETASMACWKLLITSLATTTRSATPIISMHAFIYLSRTAIACLALIG
jgi:hypothetical protein